MLFDVILSNPLSQISYTHKNGCERCERRNVLRKLRKTIHVKTLAKDAKDEKCCERRERRAVEWFLTRESVCNPGLPNNTLLDHHLSNVRAKQL